MSENRLNIEAWSSASESFIHKSFQCAVNNNVNVFGGAFSLHSHIICTRSSDSDSVSCADSTTGQTAPGVLLERLQRCAGAVECGSLLFEQLFTSAESELLVQMVMMPMQVVNVLNHFFLHAEVTYARAFQMGGCLT